jgi:GntR family transcriptional regulator, transcriptional repressor for pyruvate dehydrogenase complex
MIDVLMPEGSSLAYDEVARRLRDGILSGALVAGQRLPTEAELCERFGVSRSTVREALRVLGSQHLVTTSRGVGGGTFVAQLSHVDVTDMLHVSIRMLAQTRGCSLEEMLETRTVLEVAGAWFAAERRSPAQLDALRATVRDDLHGMPSRHIVSLNRAFHHGILEATGNRLVHLLTEPVFVVIDSIHPSVEHDLEYWDMVMADHADILGAIEARDSEAAGHLMREHLDNLRKAIPQDMVPPSRASTRKRDSSRLYKLMAGDGKQGESRPRRKPATKRGSSGEEG